MGGISIYYIAVRFKEKVHEGPSPAEYVLPSNLFKETSRKIRHYPCTCRGKLWLTRPPRSIIPTGLSVPSKRDVDGYDFDERGVLVKNPVIEHEPTDFYDVPRGETNFTTLKYKGNFWSKMKGREDGRVAVIPGPGDYEHETKKSPAEIHNERIREAKRAASKQPRFLEALYQQKLRQNFPAPNHYEPPKSPFDKYRLILCKCDPYMAEPPPFNQTAERFEEKIQSHIPGPGAYEIAARKMCYISVLRAPFGTFSARFKKPIEVTTPGPGDYHTDVGNLAFESKKRFKDKHGKMIDHLNFEEISTLASDDDEHILIDECKMTDEKKCPEYHAIFKSTVERFPGIRGNAAPDPGAYEALSAFKVNRDRCDFLRRRLAPPFGSRASRFPMIPEGVDLHVPGPSRYDLRGDISKDAKGGVICYSPRERKKDIKGPGPLHYHIHPYISSSVLKRSFNITLDRPEILKSMNETQNPWHYRHSRKVLRWFAKGRSRLKSISRQSGIVEGESHSPSCNNRA